MSRFSELEAIAESVWLVHSLAEQPSAPFLRFLMETKPLSKMTTLILALVIFEGYEIGGRSERGPDPRAMAERVPPR